MCKSSATTLEGARKFAIKLFGATISVPVSDDENGSRKRPTAAETSKIAQSSSDLEDASQMRAKLLKKSDNSSDVVDLSEMRANVLKKSENTIEISVKSEEKSKSLPKPEKAVSCPRCHSAETKFCYFNNYNVNQPRHFCKNCRRYWTAGGTMRNIPVGAGRRKSKHFSAFQLSKSVDLQERKNKAENFDQSVQLAPVFGAGDETAPVPEKIEGLNSVGFLNPAIKGFPNLLVPGAKLDGWIPEIQERGNSNILNCLVLSGRPLSTNFPTK